MALNLVAAALGAVAGAVVCGAAAAITGLARGKGLDWKTVGAAALGGVVAGGAAGLTMGASLLVSGGAMVAGGAAGGAVERTADNVLHDRTWHEGVAKHAAVGAALGVGGAATRAIAPAATAALRPAAGAVTRAGARGWAAYGRALERAPLVTKSVTSSAVMAAGDVAAQAIEGDGFDAKRTAFAGAFGLVWVGPSGHAWFGVLSRVIPGRGVVVIGKRLLLDQAVMAPVGTGVYLAAVGLYQGDSPREVVARVRRLGWPTLKQGYMLWPAANLLNFAFIPARYQVLFGNGIGLGWNTWISLRTMDDGAGPDAARDASAPASDLPPAAGDGAGLPGGPVLPSAAARAASAPASELPLAADDDGAPRGAATHPRRRGRGLVDVIGDR